MKNAPVHHLHVKYRGEIYTISHCSDVISMSELYQAIQAICELKDFEDGSK